MYWCSNHQTAGGNSIIKLLSGPLEAFSRKIHRQLNLLVPQPQHHHCMRTHVLCFLPPSESIDLRSPIFCPACLHCGNEKGCLRSRCLSSVTDNGLKYNIKPCIPVCLTNDAGHIGLHLPQIPENHPNHEWTVFSIFMLRTDRTSGH